MQVVIGGNDNFFKNPNYLRKRNIGKKEKKISLFPPFFVVIEN